jgi:GH15 family glucan-1,4-alpha-glucosidase
MASKIEDYGLIGNTYTAALVSRSGSIDWLCAPRFDSDACLAALVGYDKHGRWSLRPTASVRETRQRYRDETMILETEFACDGGAARVIDFMPVGSRCDVLRIVEGLEGEVPMEMLLDVQFGYGADAPWIEKTGDGAFFQAGPDAVILRAPLTLDLSERGVSAYVQVRKGERIPIQLTWFPSHEKPPEAIDVEKALTSTETYWREWASRCTYQGRWRDAVLRSLLVLQAMTYAPTGAIVAAPTTPCPKPLAESGTGTIASAGSAIRA